LGQGNLLKPGAEVDAKILGDVKVFLNEGDGAVEADGAKRRLPGKACSNGYP
jgi:hypothetical protein